MTHTQPTVSARLRTECLIAKCACGSERERAASDPACRISVHNTSRGHVVYYRCYCGRPQAILMSRRLPR
jgi:hypothetical protein